VLAPGVNVEAELGIAEAGIMLVLDRAELGIAEAGIMLVLDMPAMNDVELGDPAALLDSADRSVGGGVLNPDGCVVAADCADGVGAPNVGTPENTEEPKLVVAVVD
jgi:hypothetical protein